MSTTGLSSTVGQYISKYKFCEESLIFLYSLQVSHSILHLCGKHKDVPLTQILQLVASLYYIVV